MKSHGGNVATKPEIFSRARMNKREKREGYRERGREGERERGREGERERGRERTDDGKGIQVLIRTY